MNKVTAALAKVAGCRKSLHTLLEAGGEWTEGMPRQSYASEDVAHHFWTVAQQLLVLQEAYPDLYGDFGDIKVAPLPFLNTSPERYHREQVLRLFRDLDRIFEIRANSELEVPAGAVVSKRIFISHGRGYDWREVQAYIEKTIRMQTLELAQEIDGGRTIFAKLLEAADKCDSAVIVMTGDNLSAGGEVQARENVIHEIGYFQAKYGANRVILLHEEGVNIPSNMQGVIYAPFPKGLVSASFGVLVRELQAIYQ